jgi:hypothetical protein
MPSSSASPPVTATSRPSGRPSGTRPAPNGKPVLSGANTPVFSFPPELSVVARSLLLLPACPPSPTTVSSTSLSDTRPPLISSPTSMKSVVDHHGALVHSLLLMAAASLQQTSWRLPNDRARLSTRRWQRSSD